MPGSSSCPHNRDNLRYRFCGNRHTEGSVTVLTADTYTSVLPDVARTTAEAVAAQIMKAARTPPGLTTAPHWPHAPAA
jgi:hypothetical protein